jgi:uncharacterized repeat protein (TIGR04076 family)
MSNIPEKKYKVIASIKDIKGQCRFGYKVGDVIEYQQNPQGYNYVPEIVGKVCPEAFDSLYRNAFCMLFGGKIPWAKDKERTITQTACPDPFNLVTFELRQVEQKGKSKK